MTKHLDQQKINNLGIFVDKDSHFHSNCRFSHTNEILSPWFGMDLLTSDSETRMRHGEPPGHPTDEQSQSPRDSGRQPCGAVVTAAVVIVVGGCVVGAVVGFVVGFVVGSGDGSGSQEYSVEHSRLESCVSWSFWPRGHS